MFIAMALCLPAAALARRLRSWLRRMDAAAAGSELQEPLLVQRSTGSMASSAASSMVFGWATPPALQASAPGPPSRKALLLVLVPTSFDLVCSWLLNVGLLSITASVFMMLRGSEVLFAALLSRLWLGRLLNRWHLAGLGSCTAGVVLVGFAGYLEGGDPYQPEESGWTAALGMLLVILAEVVQAAQVVSEDFVMSSMALAPLSMVGLEGLYGTALTLGLVLPLAQLLPGREGGGIHEDTWESLHMLAGSAALRWAVGLTLLTVAVYNVAGMLVTDRMGATTRTVLETTRTLLIWLVNLLLYYGQPFKGAALGERWTAHSWLQAVGFGVLVAGTLTYGHGEEVQARRLRAKLRWARLRASLATLVSAHAAARPMVPPRIAGPATIRTAFVQRPEVGRLIQRMAAAGEAAPSTLPGSPLAFSFPSTMAAGGSSLMAAAAAALQADLDGLETAVSINVAGGIPSSEAGEAGAAVDEATADCAGSTMQAPEQEPTAPAAPSVAAAAGSAAPVAQAVGRRAGRLKPKDADKIISQLTLEEKLSLLNTDSPAINRSGLHIPAFNWWSECLHGAATEDEAGATIFPQSIGLAATFDRGLLGQVASAIGDELRAESNEAEKQGLPPRLTNCFSPVINIARDPRWGRLSESFGEDPFLTAELARGGLQGSNPHFVKAAATCKHFAAYSLEEFEGVSRHSFDAKIDPRDVRDTYLAAWPACVREAVSVMCSYNSINGTPACASSWLQEQLREGMGFGGFVVSDCGAVDSAWRHHRWAPGPAQAAAATLTAGTDLACTEYEGLSEAVEQGLVSETAVDAALHRLLMARFALGHFDDRHKPRNPYRRIPASVVGSPEHLALAHEAAAKSFVLLKNGPPVPPAGWAAPSGGSDEGCSKAQGAAVAAAAPLLPLRLQGLRRITVLGPMANRTEYLLGSYYGRPAGKLVSPYQAIAERAATQGVETELLAGAEVMGSAADTDGAVQACLRSDLCLFFVGTTSFFYPLSSVEERQRYGTYAMFPPVVEAEGMDRQDLLLPGRQLNLIQAVAKRTTTPIAVVLVHGAPLDVSWLQDSPRVAAILSVWMPAQGAPTIADVLFGEVSPSGRLPVSFPFNNYTAQSDFYDMSMRRWPGRTHRHLQVPVLYEFGHGLSYTSFAYSTMRAEVPAPAVAAAAPLQKGRGALLHIELDVVNAGGTPSDEIVLLFLSFPEDNQLGRQSQQNSRQRTWLPWRRWGPGLASGISAGNSPSVTLTLPCVGASSSASSSRGRGLHSSSSSSGGSRLSGSVWPEDVPRQTLAGFERLSSLAPRQRATARFALSLETFRPFSPLDAGSSGMPGAPVRPYCGRYVLRAGSQELELWVEDAGPAAALQ
ncbi:glycosyl hydrolase isoform A [Chlorella sorokiniana]|uniref:Glycosyl hydrolase isoform A n=1 Tax=Chlorella sorokiniana TaxID=3076 RepID=A0A2P6U1E0_CHLSO|nr:glycosyl hydrolase isoform A [Chlorella sorokiniana]|eukprot:PRW60118.1 glycosyl hydrolase isoform A [Chlorella sorokiniana]